MESNCKTDQLKNSIMTYESTCRSDFEENTSRQDISVSHRDPIPLVKEYHQHFNKNCIHLKHNCDDFLPCPHCGTGYARTLVKDKALLSYKHPRESPSKCNFLKRLSSLFRPKHATTIAEEDYLPVCDVCQQQVITKFVQQKWYVTPLFNKKRSKSRRPANSSSYRNTMRDHYANRLPNTCIEISSHTLLTDTESEHFVRSTNYSFCNQMEDDLKQALLKEYFRRKRKYKRVVSSSSSPQCSSKEFGDCPFNDAKRKFKELNRIADKTEPKIDQASYTINSTSSAYLSKTKGTTAETVLTQTDCANTYCPSGRKDYGNSNIQLTKKSSSKLSLKERKKAKTKASIQKDPEVHNGTATDLISMFTRYSPSRNSSFSANISPPSSRYDMHSISNQNIDASKPQEPNVLSAQNSGSSDLQTEDQYSPKEISANQQVIMLHLSEENIQHSTKTQTGIKKSDIPSYKMRSNNTNEKSCQCVCQTDHSKCQAHPVQVVKFESRRIEQDSNYWQHQQPKGVCVKDCQCQTDQKTAMKMFKPRHVMHVMVDNSQDNQRQNFDLCQSRQADKVIQSVCVHNPPCELVPNCFKVKYNLDLINYCVHVPLCARMPMCSLSQDEKSRFEDLSSRQLASQGNADTQVAMTARMPNRTVQAVQTWTPIQTPRMAVQACNMQHTWISAFDQIHQIPVELPMSATCPTCAHAVYSSIYDGSVLSAKTPFIQNQKSSFMSGQNKFTKIFRRLKRSL